MCLGEKRSDCFYWELHGGKIKPQAIRFDQWKAIRPYLGAALELYDLSSDAGESRDVAANHADILAKAEGLIRREDVEDPNWPLLTPSVPDNKSRKKR